MFTSGAPGWLPETVGEHDGPLQLYVAPDIFWGSLHNLEGGLLVFQGFLFFVCHLLKLNIIHTVRFNTIRLGKVYLLTVSCFPQLKNTETMKLNPTSGVVTYVLCCQTWCHHLQCHNGCLHPGGRRNLSVDDGGFDPKEKLGTGGFNYFLCSPRSLGKWSNLTIIFFKSVGVAKSVPSWAISKYCQLISSLTQFDRSEVVSWISGTHSLGRLQLIVQKNFGNTHWQA